MDSAISFVYLQIQWCSCYWVLKSEMGSSASAYALPLVANGLLFSPL